MIDDELKLVLEPIVKNPGLYLRDIHQALVDERGTRFQYSPEPGAGWNEERREVQNLLHKLGEIGLAEVEGRGKPWYPTEEGKKIVSE